MSKVWERTFSAIYDPLLWVAERAGMGQRRTALLSQARGQVLELGAGTGLNLPHYPDRLDELVLTEPSPPMVARLEQRAKKSGTPSSVMAAEAERLPFEHDRFDTVVSTLVLCTVDEPRQAIDEIARVLRPGGKLLFSSTCGRTRDAWPAGRTGCTGRGTRSRRAATPIGRPWTCSAKARSGSRPSNATAGAGCLCSSTH
jgi:SAM-dependent methyltransferase